MSSSNLCPGSNTYNLGKFMRTPAFHDVVEQWSLTRLGEKLIKTGAIAGAQAHGKSWGMSNSELLESEIAVDWCG